MLDWMRAHPTASRIMLRFGLRLALAIAIVVPLGTICAAYDLSPNVAAIVAVVLALWLGGKAAEMAAVRLNLPPEAEG